MHWYGFQAVLLGLVVHTSAKLALALPGFRLTKLPIRLPRAG